jgi:hypothetical protein
LPATCIGRDYRGAIGASVTSSRTGVQLESVVAGVKVGLVEGIEVHLLGLAIGLHFWPPGITLPVNPGCLGFTVDRSSERPHFADLEREAGEPPSRRVGSGSAWLRARGAVVANPSSAGGVVGVGTLGFGLRGLYGRRVGFAFRLDLDVGAAGPPGFVYTATLFPAGVGVTFGETGVLALRAGVGVFGVTARLAPALAMPAELRLELDVTRRARVGLVASATWNVGPPSGAAAGCSDAWWTSSRRGCSSASAARGTAPAATRSSAPARSWASNVVNSAAPSGGG